MKNEQISTKTPTSEAKEIIVTLLKSKQGSEFSISEIKGEITRKATQTMTEGTISGAIHSLTKDRKSGVVNVSRGIYSYDKNAIQHESDLTAKLYNGVTKSVEILEDVAKNINPLDLDEKDIPILQKMKKLIGDLEDFNEKLFETYGEKVND